MSVDTILTESAAHAATPSPLPLSTLSLSYSFGGTCASSPLVSRRVIVDVHDATCTQDALLQRTDALVADVLNVFDDAMCTFVASGRTDEHALEICVAALEFVTRRVLCLCPSMLYVKLSQRVSLLESWVCESRLAFTKHAIQRAKACVDASYEDLHA